MPDPENLVCDAAPAISLGRRACQEDALAVDFTAGAGFGFAVLSDGMGGHAAGEIASKVVVTEMFSELKMQAGNPVDTEKNIGAILRNAALGANDCLASYTQRFPETRGMGATLIAPVIAANRLYWISVGDSPLFLFRGNRLFRLNEEHSLGQQLKIRVLEGRLSQEQADLIEDQDCLTSVLMGRNIQHTDCREIPVTLRHNDIIVAASDGLLYLTEDQIARILHDNCFRSSAEISEKLMQAVAAQDDPEQDNISLCTIRITDPSVTGARGPMDTRPKRRLFLNLHENSEPAAGTLRVLR
ncbi:protein phosphatase 2C domain-containing protein [uncultured Roseobacter sp.]|uniref:PP2C family protein-serine/threonine phosphatase n=1 Tax=uncultured Roseobacter sp. TaxID=114847 RepID=UPI002635C6FA|nr:protein phosphatase 2C domain-containing protein [uncultured Roseobacter sp.]